MIEQIAHLLEHETAGDPIKGLKWRRRATRKIAQQLRRLKIQVSASTVRRLLKQMGYSLRVNHKKLESGNQELAAPTGAPSAVWLHRASAKTISGAGEPHHQHRCEKKGNDWKFQEPRDWLGEAAAVGHGSRLPQRRQRHGRPLWHLRSGAESRFRGGGTSHETPAFAVDAVTLWWKSYGQRMYRQAKGLFILADSGGGNSARSRGWPYHLQQKLVNPHRLTVTVSHYLPGASKWNPIEHRVFCQISKNWAGQPLKSFQTALNYIRTTTTLTGLKVRARLLRKKYEKGERISAQEMKHLALTRHKTLPKWNYTLRPM